MCLVRYLYFDLNMVYGFKIKITDKISKKLLITLQLIIHNILQLLRLINLKQTIIYCCFC